MYGIPKRDKWPSAKLQVKAFHLDGKWFFRTQENLANMNVTTFNSLKCENAHFRLDNTAPLPQFPTLCKVCKMPGKNNTQWSHILKCTCLFTWHQNWLQAPTSLVFGCISWDLSPYINWAECEGQHSVQSSAQFKKCYTSTPPHTPPWTAHRQHLPFYPSFCVIRGQY